MATDKALDADAGGFYSTTEVARIFGVTPKTVASWCDRGRLPCILTSAGHRRIPVSAIKGGRDHDAKLAAFRARIADRTKGLPIPSDQEIAEQVLERRDPERAERRSS